MKKNRLFVLALAFLGVASWAQQRSVIPIEKGEKWYGGITALGSKMPLSGDFPKQSLSKVNYNNQSVPFLVSNYGRYIYSKDPFAFEFKAGEIVLESPTEQIQAVKGGKTLREGYVVARNAHFKGSGAMPDKLFFSVPQYNTWIELMYDQNQEDILKYADDIIANGFEPGILMIDDNWQRYYGNYDFKAERFSDAKGMIDRLHSQGFKVMVWICPFLSADTPEFRHAEKKGYLIKRKGGSEAAIIRWWNGSSACYDLTNPEAMQYLTAQLKNTQEKYGIDGFKFDAGDVNFYDPKTQDYFQSDALPNDHTRLWAKLGLSFPYNEYRACWEMQGEALVQRLGDKDYSWGALGLLIPEMINAGIMGYAYTCPDMIGGGQFGSFLGVDYSKLDQALIVRSAQIHALMPMMQFSVAPWRVLDKEHLGYCVEASKLHKKLAPYILEMASESSRTGEPVVRSMEYMFPGQGFSECLDQFMLGNKYLVAPVLTRDGKRTVRLPRGVWTDDLGKKIRGPLVLEIQVDMGRLPYFEKK